jgi:predicted SAM-dependent methyltransferase
MDATEGLWTLLRAAGRLSSKAISRRSCFASRRLAGVFARHSYLHLPKRRLGPALTEAARVLRPGGLLLMSMIQGDYEGRALPDDDFPGR